MSLLTRTDGCHKSRLREWATGFWESGHCLEKQATCLTQLRMLLPKGSMEDWPQRKILSTTPAPIPRAATTSLPPDDAAPLRKKIRKSAVLRARKHNAQDTLKVHRQVPDWFMGFLVLGVGVCMSGGSD